MYWHGVWVLHKPHYHAFLDDGTEPVGLSFVFVGHFDRYIPAQTDLLSQSDLSHSAVTKYRTEG